MAPGKKEVYSNFKKQNHDPRYANYEKNDALKSPKGIDIFRDSCYVSRDTYGKARRGLYSHYLLFL